MARGPVDVVTLKGFDKTDLQVDVLKLERRVRMLATVVGLLKAVIRGSGFKMEGQRLPTHGEKSGLLESIDRAIKTIPPAQGAARSASPGSRAVARLTCASPAGVDHRRVIVAKENSVAAFADAVMETLQRDQSERIARGRVIAHAFDWELVGGRILDVFERAAGRGGRRS